VSPGRDVARCWAAFASLGAGLVHVAQIREQPGVLAVGVAALACWQLGWGTGALARSTTPLPRTAGAVSLAAMAGWLVSPGTAEAMAVSLEALMLVALLLWARPGVALTGRQLRAGGRLASLGLGALVVAALATPGMAATAAGEHSHGHGGAVPQLTERHDGH